MLGTVNGREASGAIQAHLQEIVVEVVLLLLLLLPLFLLLLLLRALRLGESSLAQQLEAGVRGVPCSVQLKDKQATPGEVFFEISFDFDQPRHARPVSGGYRPQDLTKPPFNLSVRC